jgi:hypothetical protein
VVESDFVCEFVSEFVFSDLFQNLLAHSVQTLRAQRPDAIKLERFLGHTFIGVALISTLKLGNCVLSYTVFVGVLALCTLTDLQPFRRSGTVEVLVVFVLLLACKPHKPSAITGTSQTPKHTIRSTSFLLYASEFQFRCPPRARGYEAVGYSRVNAR